MEPDIPTVGNGWGSPGVSGFGNDSLLIADGTYPENGSVRVGIPGGTAAPANFASWLPPDAFNLASAGPGNRQGGVQLMMVAFWQFSLPGVRDGAYRDEAIRREPRFAGMRRFFSSLSGLFRRRPQGEAFHPPSAMLLSPFMIGPGGTVSPMTPRSERSSSSVAQTTSALAATFSALGVSTGEAFRVQMVNGNAYPIGGGAAGLVVEPLNSKAQKAVQEEFNQVASGKTTQYGNVDAYCLEFLQQPPEPGTMFRVAAPEVQSKFHSMRNVLQAGKKLMDVGGLTPDSDETQYFQSILQWSLWTKERGFDMKAFGTAFLERTKKNFTAAKQPWTKQIKKVVGDLVPNRWKDIERILAEADVLDRGAGPN